MFVPGHHPVEGDWSYCLFTRRRKAWCSVINRPGRSRTGSSRSAGKRRSKTLSASDSGALRTCKRSWIRCRGGIYRA